MKCTAQLIQSTSISKKTNEDGERLFNYWIDSSNRSPLSPGLGLVSISLGVSQSSLRK